MPGSSQDIGMARILFGIGALFLVLGAVAWGMERMGLRPGRLPGDIVLGGGGTRVYFPIVTCIVLSAVLSLLFWVVGALRR
jgi:hypothetical protein